jgi:hypothetical protein
VGRIARPQPPHGGPVVGGPRHAPGRPEELSPQVREQQQQMVEPLAQPTFA